MLFVTEHPTTSGRRRPRQTRFGPFQTTDGLTDLPLSSHSIITSIDALALAGHFGDSMGAGQKAGISYQPDCGGSCGPSGLGGGELPQPGHELWRPSRESVTALS